MRKIKFRNFLLKIFLPIFLAISLILGLSIGIPLLIRRKHPIAENITLKLEIPMFSSNPDSSSYKYNNHIHYSPLKYINYWAMVSDSNNPNRKIKQHQIVKYTTEYKETYNVGNKNKNIKTVEDFILIWNKDFARDHDSKILIKTSPPSSFGVLILNFLNKDDTNKYIPSIINPNKSSISITSETNSTSKDTQGIISRYSTYALSNMINTGVSSQYMEDNDIFNLISWPSTWSS